MMSKALREELGFLFDEIARTFDTQIGITIYDTGGEIFAHDGKKRVFGSEINIHLRDSHTRGVDKYENGVVEINHGSCGAFNPDDNESVGTFNAILRGRLVECWNSVKPILIKHMKQEYERQMEQSK
jgi:hypothetical protein